MLQSVQSCFVFEAKSSRLGNVEVVLSTLGQLYANTDFQKEKLVLLPCGPVQVMPPEKVSKSSVILQMTGMGKKQVLAVQATRCDFEKEKGHFIPFFWMKEAAEGDDFCMVRGTVKYKELAIPCLKNSKALVKGTALVAQSSTAPKKKAKK